MHPSGLPQLAALLTLGYGTAFALDLEEWSLGVIAGGSSVSFDAGFAYEGPFVSGVEVGEGGWTKGLPCKLLVVNFHLVDGR